MKAVTPSRSEEGCIKYVLHQSIENKAVFVFYEIWKDEESINRQVYRLQEVNS
ncbi:hypothetical protein G5B47_15185 [Paenibacillus sp. 7124]|uniref:ABM domain-containing protein n=1 Tax=Paenibacillus apii TaxID=1850370 RepID=A0A6M1PMQ3_9BACL|nr:hypothetical protein [Paenibacillus apii]NJJ41131.1 hypothetical protein [Paenibacillus apii]